MGVILSIDGLPLALPSKELKNIGRGSWAGHQMLGRDPAWQRDFSPIRLYRDGNGRGSQTNHGRSDGREAQLQGVYSFY